MNHHSVKFLLESNSEIAGIVADAVGTDEDIAFDVGRLEVWKRDDVGEGVVFEVLHIEIVQVIVAAKDEGCWHCWRAQRWIAANWRLQRWA